MQNVELLENRVILLRNKNIQLLRQEEDLRQRNLELLADKQQLFDEREELNNLITNLRIENETLTNQNTDHIRITEAQNILIQKYLDEIEHYKNNNSWLMKCKKIRNLELILMNMFAIILIVYIYSLLNTQFVIISY